MPLDSVRTRFSRGDTGQELQSTSVATHVKHVVRRYSALAAPAKWRAISSSVRGVSSACASLRAAAEDFGRFSDAAIATVSVVVAGRMQEAGSRRAASR